MSQVSSGQAHQDAEEYIEVSTVSVKKLKELMFSGEMLLPSVTTCFLALERLKRLGVLEDKA